MFQSESSRVFVCPALLLSIMLRTSLDLSTSFNFAASYYALAFVGFLSFFYFCRLPFLFCLFWFSCDFFVLHTSHSTQISSHSSACSANWTNTYVTAHLASPAMLIINGHVTNIRRRKKTLGCAPLLGGVASRVAFSFQKICVHRYVAYALLIYKFAKSQKAAWKFRAPSFPEFKVAVPDLALPIPLVRNYQAAVIDIYRW